MLRPQRPVLPEETPVKKLTLNLEEEEVRLARELAREEGVSVSALFANLLRGRIAMRRKAEQEKLPPLTRKALGMARLPKGKTERELVEESLAEKYGIDL